MNESGKELEYYERDLEIQERVVEINVDQRLLTKWHCLAKGGSFRYLLGNGRQRVLPGQFSFLAQYQPNRAKMRRTPQAMHSLTQKPDPTKFNFTKVDESKELVFVLKNLDKAQDQGRSILLINVSPIDEGHCLLVPNVEALLPQQVTEAAALTALHLLCLSTSPDIRIGFNSLCAHASVNHMHWHVYYQAHRAAVLGLILECLVGPIYTWGKDQYPAQGWCLLVPSCEPKTLSAVARHLSKLTNWLVEKEVAHNVFLCPGEKNQPARVLVWPRESVLGAKDPGAFAMAVCELSGQVLVYEETKYESLTEDTVTTAQIATTENLYKELTPEVIKLFSNECFR